MRINWDIKLIFPSLFSSLPKWLPLALKHLIIQKDSCLLKRLVFVVWDIAQLLLIQIKLWCKTVVEFLILILTLEIKLIQFFTILAGEKATLHESYYSCSNFFPVSFVSSVIFYNSNAMLVNAMFTTDLVQFWHTPILRHSVLFINTRIRYFFIVLLFCKILTINLEILVFIFLYAYDFICHFSQNKYNPTI